jgi:NADH-quinone oxidoreductase subunit L
MGGLRKYLRVAYFGMGAGCLAIAGVPGFAGFFAKDDVLASALAYGGVGIFCWVVGVVGAFLTALYMFRMLFRAFFGKEPAGGYDPTPHPSRWWMSVPVIILGVLSIVSGWVQVPFGWTEITTWLDPVVAGVTVTEPTHGTEIVTIIASVIAAAGGIALAWWLFGADPERRIRLARIAQGPRGVMRDAWRFDEAYDDLFVEPGREVADVMATTVEPAGPQGIITGTTALVRSTARVVSASQSGLVRAYAFWMVLGISAVGIILAIVVAGGG